MSQMKTVRTAELIGEVLDLMVAVAIGGERKPYRFASNEDAPMNMAWVFPDGYAATSWRPSTEWSQAGRLIKKFKITVGSDWDGESLVSVWAYCGPAFEGWPVVTAQEYLVAVCRAIVAANLGDEVQIPAELLP
ncbi:hypothetical protein L682_30050 [Aquipseudomonas alcaligenes OT 69]|nr:hypothetical protein L682_30050 [Pseudomonas alcaligenes OT 69]